MAWNALFFYLLGIISVLAAIGMVAVRNPVHSAIVLVLMLFFLMLIDPQKLPERGSGHPVQRIVGPLLGVILFLEVAAAIANRAMIGTTGNATPENIAFVGGSTQAFGNLIFTQALLPFEVVSLVLLIGVVGAIVLALPERLGERLATISLGHPRGTDLALPEGPSTAAPITQADRQATGALEATREIILVGDPDLYTGATRRKSE